MGRHGHAIVDLLTNANVRVSLSAQEQELAEVKLAYTGPLMAPVEAGTEVGKVRFIVDGLTVADVAVVTARCRSRRRIDVVAGPRQPLHHDLRKLDARSSS